jgi:hypothetical protein
MRLARRELIRFIAYGLDSCGTVLDAFLNVVWHGRAHHFRFLTRLSHQASMTGLTGA